MVPLRVTHLVDCSDDQWERGDGTDPVSRAKGQVPELTKSFWPGRMTVLGVILLRRQSCSTVMSYFLAIRDSVSPLRTS